MSRWKHAPCHIFQTIGTYIVTGATLQKELFFKSNEDLDLFQSIFFELAQKYEWRLEAWALFANHYHFIARSPNDPSTLQRFITHLHSASARELNKKHCTPGRKIWYQYWDTNLTFHKSYLARLKYVMSNPVKHRIVDRAENYPWCSASWFKEHSTKSYLDLVYSCPIEELSIFDDY